MENNKKLSQCDRILKYLNDFGSITQLEALQDLGIMRLASRIHNLRKSGYAICGDTVEVKNRYGEICRIKKYKLGENEFCNCTNIKKNQLCFDMYCFDMYCFETYGYDSVHPQKQMEKLGYKVIDAVPQSIADCWWFTVEEFIEPLPPYLSKIEYKLGEENE